MAKAKKDTKGKEVKNSEETVVKVQALDIGQVEVTVEGISPLLQNRFSEEAQEQIEKKQQGKGRQEKAAKDPMKLAESRLYKLDPARKGCKYGHPGAAFEAAMIRAGKPSDFAMADLKCAIFVEVGNDALVPIRGAEKWELDSRRVVISNSTLDIRHRPRIPIGWQADLIITFDKSFISADQVINLLARAGFSVGIGDYRPFSPKGKGPFGRFHILEQ